MNKTKTIITSAFIVILLLCAAVFTACEEPNFPDYVRNVQYLRLKENSSSAVICWDKFENAEEYIVYRGTEKKGGTIKEIGRTKNTVYGTASEEYINASYSYFYGVVAVVGGKTTYCSKFVGLDEIKTYEDLQ